LNTPASITAYIWYYHWWNLVRLTRLFAALPSASLPVEDGGVCVDIGSGPLTAVSALYLSRPDLRKKNLTWYCVDRSRAIMEKGEDLFFSLTAAFAALPDTCGTAAEWKIVRVHGGAGTALRKKAQLVIASNVYNEILEQQESVSIEKFAARAAAQIASYAQKDGAAIVVEPGTPRAARFISLLRGKLLERGSIISPCAHARVCPMDARKGGKWCHFTFSTSGAPEALLRLSEKAALPKEKAALSFIAARFGGCANNVRAQKSAEKAIAVRIASNAIKLPEGRTGFYGCSRLGLTLVEASEREKNPAWGDIVFAQKANEAAVDKKTGAIIVMPAKL
jgi:hypothetical protein